MPERVPGGDTEERPASLTTPGLSARALHRFQRRVEDALEAMGGDRDAARKVRDAVADAARGQGQSGVTSAIEVGSGALGGARALCSGWQEGSNRPLLYSVSICSLQAVHCACITSCVWQAPHACTVGSRRRRP